MYYTKILFIFKVTDEFSQNNFIDGVEVGGADKSFVAECETFVPQRNLIKIIAACSGTDFKGNDLKTLVFELIGFKSMQYCNHTHNI